MNPAPCGGEKKPHSPTLTFWHEIWIRLFSAFESWLMEAFPYVQDIMAVRHILSNYFWSCPPHLLVLPLPSSTHHVFPTLRTCVRGPSSPINICSSSFRGPLEHSFEFICWFYPYKRKAFVLFFGFFFLSFTSLASVCSRCSCLVWPELRSAALTWPPSCDLCVHEWNKSQMVNKGFLQG